MLSWKVYVLYKEKLLENLVVADNAADAMIEATSVGWQVEQVMGVVLVNLEEVLNNETLDHVTD